MHSKTIRVVLIAAACLALSTTTTEGNDQAQPGVKDLIDSSGYMVAVG